MKRLVASFLGEKLLGDLLELGLSEIKMITIYWTAFRVSVGDFAKLFKKSFAQP